MCDMHPVLCNYFICDINKTGMNPQQRDVRGQKKVGSRPVRMPETDTDYDSDDYKKVERHLRYIKLEDRIKGK